MDIQKYQDLISEIKVNSDKSTTWSIRGAGRLCDLSSSTLIEAFSTDRNTQSKLAQTLIQQGFQPNTFGKVGITEDALMCILEYYAYKAGKHSRELPGYVLSFIRQHGIQNLTNTEFNKLKNKVNKKSNGNPEKEIQLAYHQELGGLIEVETDHGRIDLLTDDSIYEFKTLSKYKEALGQLLMYGLTFPKHKKIAVLFNCRKKDISHIVCDFKKYNVEVIKLV